MLQGIKQRCRIFFSLAIIRHQALDERAQFIGGGTVVEELRRMGTALYFGKRVRNERELFFDDVQARKLIVRLNEMIDDLADVRLDQTDGADVGLRRNAFKQLREVVLELVETLADGVKTVIGPDVGERLLDALGDFGEATLEPILINGSDLARGCRGGFGNCRFRTEIRGTEIS